MVILPCDEGGLIKAVEALRRDEVVAYPTETVYGLAVNPFSEKALENLFNVKGRKDDSPVLLVIGELEMLYALVETVSDNARRCIEKFWPGPLSLLFTPSAKLSPKLCGRSGKVCIRWSSHPTSQKLSSMFGGAITSTSANKSGAPPAKSAGEILHLEGIALILDGGCLSSNYVSTVFDPDTCEIIREGAIKRDELLKIIGD
ncbi:MAG: L-threonylcarbamoyladenylate synthase [Candidatus Hydrogenedentes bacterium]|nr:L-threonylcarbamoyladenylate synthase [Candidatus Hydrogenedentota bacterium]